MQSPNEDFRTHVELSELARAVLAADGTLSERHGDAEVVEVAAGALQQARGLALKAGERTGLNRLLSVQGWGDGVGFRLDFDTGEARMVLTGGVSTWKEVDARWGNAIPGDEPVHFPRFEEVEERLEALPGLDLAVIRERASDSWRVIETSRMSAIEAEDAGLCILQAVAALREAGLPCGRLGLVFADGGVFAWSNHQSDYFLLGVRAEDLAGLGPFVAAGEAFRIL